MLEIGYALSSEEFTPAELVRNAALAEEAGFPFALISDHYHPWTNRQGHSAFVWGVIGGIAQVTRKLRLGTGVTCPTVRIHPAVIAQAAATAACMLPGRFFLGVGTGENLNEHILGGAWPETEVRLEMLEEAIQVMRLLWKGGTQSHHGKHYTVENACVYDLPEQPVEIYMAAGGKKSAEVAGRVSDGLISVSPDRETLRIFEQAGGKGKPRYGQVTVCYDPDEKKARKLAHEIWPTAAIPGELSQELPTPTHFEQAAKLVTEDKVAESIVCGPDPERHVKAIQEFADAGCEHVYVHAIGDQQAFFRFYAEQVLPRFVKVGAGLSR